MNCPNCGAPGLENIDNQICKKCDYNHVRPSVRPEVSLVFCEICGVHYFDVCPQGHFDACKKVDWSNSK